MPQIQAALNELLGGSVEEIQAKFTKNEKFDAKGYSKYIQDALLNPEKIKEFNNNTDEIITDAVDYIDTLDKSLKDYITFNSDRSGLSSGIESITEDTARTLEGLFNSQLGVTLQIRQLLEDHFVNGDNGSGTNAIMTSIQTHVGAINSNVALILQGLNEVRDTQSRPIHVTMV